MIFPPEADRCRTSGIGSGTNWLTPALLAALPPGADEAALAAPEAKVGVPLPTDVRASSLIHDGSGGEWFEPDGELLGLAGIADERGVWRDLVVTGVFADSESEPDGPIRTDWFHLKWIPITHNGGGDRRCLDLDPAPGGTVGQAIDFSHEEGALNVLAHSFRAWLEAYAANLATDRDTVDADGYFQHADDEAD